MISSVLSKLKRLISQKRTHNVLKGDTEVVPEKLAADPLGYDAETLKGLCVKQLKAFKLLLDKVRRSGGFCIVFFTSLLYF